MKKVFVGRMKSSVLTGVLKDVIFFSCIKSLEKSDGCGITVVGNDYDLRSTLDQLEGLEDDTLLLLYPNKIKELESIMFNWPVFDFRFGNDELFLVKDRNNGDGNNYYFQTRKRYCQTRIPMVKLN